MLPDFGRQCLYRASLKTKNFHLYKHPQDAIQRWHYINRNTTQRCKIIHIIFFKLCPWIQSKINDLEPAKRCVKRSLWSQNWNNKSYILFTFIFQIIGDYKRKKPKRFLLPSQLPPKLTYFSGKEPLKRSSKQKPKSKHSPSLKNQNILRPRICHSLQRDSEKPSQPWWHQACRGKRKRAAHSPPTYHLPTHRQTAPASIASRRGRRRAGAAPTAAPLPNTAPRRPLTPVAAPPPAKRRKRKGGRPRACARTAARALLWLPVHAAQSAPRVSTPRCRFLKGTGPLSVWRPRELTGWRALLVFATRPGQRPSDPTRVLYLEQFLPQGTSSTRIESLQLLLLRPHARSQVTEAANFLGNRKLRGFFFYDV